MSDAMTQGSGDSTLSPTSRTETGLQGLGRIALVIGLWLLVAVVYWPSTLAMARLWVNTAEETYTHGYLILLISLWLALRERHRLAEVPIAPVPGALIVLLALSALWTWSWRASIQELHLMLLPVILFTAVLAAFGTRAARLLAFPIGYLYFALPFWSDFNFLLRDLSARMTGVLLWLTGVPGFMQGNFIMMPAGTIQIAGGCSGLHAFIVGLALAALYVKLFDLSGRRRLFALVLMAGIALIVNWLRIFVVTAAAYATDMQTSLVRNHYWLGWWLFAAGFAGFLWWMERKPVRAQTRLTPAGTTASQAPQQARLSAPSRSSLPRTVALVLGLALALLFLVAFATGLHSSLARDHYWLGWSLCAAALAAFLWWVGRKRSSQGTSDTGATQVDSSQLSPTRLGLGVAPLGAVIVALAVLPAAAYGMDWAHADNSTRVTIHWPVAPAGWQGPTSAMASKWQPYFRDAGGQSLVTYTDEKGESVQAFAVVYRVQTQKAKLLSYWNHLLGKTSTLHSQSQHNVNTASGRWIETAVVDSTDVRSLIWSRYRVGSRVFVNPRLSQLWYGLAALIDPPLSSLIAMRAKCQSDCRAARKQLETLSRVAQPRFLPTP